MAATSVIFCGTPDFAVPSLQALIEDTAFDVQLVVTQPDKPVGRKQVVTPPPVKVTAENAGIEVWQPEDIIVGFDVPAPDFLVVVAYGQILTQPLLDFPTTAPVNLHASLLPHWRGASPIQQSILTGDDTTGVTLQRMVSKLDAGPILAQEETEVRAEETAQSLHDRLAVMGATLLVETLKQPLNETEQDESQATFCKKLTRKQGRVDPQTMTAEEIDRHVRALVPWPGVTCSVHGKDVKLHAVSLEEVSDTIALNCSGDTNLWITKLQSPGGKALAAGEWMRGHL